MRISWLFALLVPALVGCGPKEAGESCSEDDDCAQGLSCLGPEAESISFPVMGGGSAPVCGAPDEGICSIECDTDADCASLGAGFACVSTGGDCPTDHCGKAR